MGRLITWMLSSVASFRFWLAQKRFKVHRDYNIQRAANDTILVEIIRGKYANVKFTYDDIKLNEFEPLVEFKTLILENPNGVDLTENKFLRIANNIFRSLIREVLHEARTLDTAEPDEEREFYEESSPLLEKRILRRESRSKAIRPDSESHNKVQ